MTTVTILPIYDASCEKSDRAVAGDKHSIAKDAMTDQLGENEFSALLFTVQLSPTSHRSTKQ